MAHFGKIEKKLLSPNINLSEDHKNGLFYFMQNKYVDFKYI